MLVPTSSLMPAAAETWTWELPSWVLSRRRAVFAALEENQRGEVVGLFPKVSLRLFLECDCRTLRTVLGFGLRSDGEGCDLSAVVCQHRGRLGQMLLGLPKAEEVSHFFLTRVVGNVLHLGFNKLVIQAPRVNKGSLHEQRWTT